MAGFLPVSCGNRWLLQVALVLIWRSPTDAVVAQEEDEPENTDEGPATILAGWYDVCQLLEDLLLVKPKSAEVVSALLTEDVRNVDFIDVIDLFSAQQPTILVFIIATLCYVVTLVVGTPLYFWARSHELMGGDRTQDINESYKFVLQALTVAFVICVAVAGLTICITALTVYFQAPLVTGSRPGLFSNLNEVGDYVSSIAEELRNLTRAKTRGLKGIEKSAQRGLVKVVYEYYLPEVERQTTFARVPAPRLFHTFAELAQQHSRVSGMVRAAENIKSALQKNLTWFIASNFVDTYKTEIQAILGQVPKTLELVKSTEKEISDETAKFKKSLSSFMARFDDNSKNSLTAVFGKRFLYYGTASIVLCGALLVFFSGAFLVGLGSHDDTVAPTKRSVISERAGDTLLAGIGLNAAFGSFIAVFTVVLMLTGVLADGYACKPYRNLMSPDEPDQSSAKILDAVWDTVWSESSRGKFFATLAPGYWFLNCDTERKTIELLPAALSQRIEELQNSSDVIVNKLKDLKVAPDKLLPGKGPEGMRLADYVELTHGLKDKVQAIPFELANSVDKKVSIKLPKQDPPAMECGRLYNIYQKAFGSFCEMTLKNHNGWWLAMYICLLLLGALAIMSHHASRYFLRMNNYTYDGSEVESTSSAESIKGGTSDKSSSVFDLEAADGKKVARKKDSTKRKDKRDDASTAAKTSDAAEEEKHPKEEGAKENNEQVPEEVDIKPNNTPPKGQTKFGYGQCAVC
ncbi:hypothetical protein HPB48_005467 [Haemaphysalis longicornis]|uniref:Uncharacterized protein n=1 Tax=Haemaphysalis longicornis TaxID=44386 RepID=A0A9J6GSR6_HAELO|nr:hypothetical protein HPB48_005467 [Haemaphysalis longicornis]